MKNLTRKAVINAVLLKSKTININALAAGLVIILQQFGADLDTNAVATVLIAMNVVLRFITEKSLEDK